MWPSVYSSMRYWVIFHRESLTLGLAFDVTESTCTHMASEIASAVPSAPQTSDNLVKGNEYLDSAAQHARDFRLLVLAFLITASFSLLFLDWYYD